MKTTLIWSIKATVTTLIFVGLASLINYVISLVFLTTFSDVQLSAIWIIHVFAGVGISIAAAEHDKESKQ